MFSDLVQETARRLALCVVALAPVIACAALSADEGVGLEEATKCPTADAVADTLLEIDLDTTRNEFGLTWKMISNLILHKYHDVPPSESI